MRQKKYLFILILFVYLIYLNHLTPTKENIESKSYSIVTEHPKAETKEVIFQPELIFHEPKVRKLLIKGHFLLNIFSSKSKF